jgi:hypothetical protein
LLVVPPLFAPAPPVCVVESFLFELHAAKHKFASSTHAGNEAALG